MSLRGWAVVVCCGLVLVAGLLPAAGAFPAGVPDDVPSVQRNVADLVSRQLVPRTALFFTVAGLYLLASLCFLLHWFLPDRAGARREGTSLALALLALVMTVHTVAASGVAAYLVPQVVGPMAQALVETAAYLLSGGLVALLLWAFFPYAFRVVPAGPVRLPPFADGLPAGRQASAWLQTVNTTVTGAALATSFVFAAAVPFLPPVGVAYVLSAARWVTVALMVVVVAVVWGAVERRRPMAAGLAPAFALLVVGSLHDAFFAGSGANGHAYFSTYTVLAFVLTGGYFVVRGRVRGAGHAARDSERLQREVAQRTKELRAATIAAQAANLAKSQFLTAVSHELRTPLTAMLGYTQLLEEELKTQLAPRQHEFFDTIQTSGDRLLSMINDLLDLARIEAGRLDLKIADVDAVRVVREVQAQLYPLVHEKGLGFDFHVEAGAERVRADEQRLRQVLLNLLSNAIKFTDEGGIVVRTYATTLHEWPAVAVSVRDTGPGISPDFLPFLFDRFTQETRVYPKAPGGTGVGLTISRELVVRMGGEIVVESKQDAGAVFTVVLPAA